MSFTGGVLVIFLMLLMLLMLLLGIGVLPSLAPGGVGVRGAGDGESTWEAFQSQTAQGKKGQQAQMDALESADSPLMEYPPGKPCPVALYSSEPYHLLSDVLPSVGEEALSCVTSRSCFATDMEAQMAKTGNYRQWTNQYKRGYPDHCSAPRQELVLSMYQASPLVLARA